MHNVQGWISVKDRLPEDDKLVIVSGGLASFRNNKWYSATYEEYPGKPIMWEVTHWQPMPKLKPEGIIAEGLIDHGV